LNVPFCAIAAITNGVQIKIVGIPANSSKIIVTNEILTA
jgi:hypothetical protein